MRALLGFCAVVVCLSAASANDTGGLAGRIRLSASAFKALRAGLPASVRQNLAAKITPQQQLAAIEADPSMRAQLQNLQPRASVMKLSDPAWQAGITLTPLAQTYPPEAGYGEAQLVLTTRAAHFSQFAPLPTAAQDPPLLWLNVAGNNTPLVWIEANWPEPGPYLITFFLKDLWPNSSARPRVRGSSGFVQPAPNAPTGGDQWTVLWNVDDPGKLRHEIAVYPPESGASFLICCLSKVVVSRLVIG